MAQFPTQRLRRLRSTPTLRRMTRETRVLPEDLIAPLFVENGEGLRAPIAAMPGQNRLSPDTAAEEASAL
jgi:porphobilinogen synthase